MFPTGSLTRGFRPFPYNTGYYTPTARNCDSSWFSVLLVRIEPARIAPQCTGPGAFVGSKSCANAAALCTCQGSNPEPSRNALATCLMMANPAIAFPAILRETQENILGRRKCHARGGGHVYKGGRFAAMAMTCLLAIVTTTVETEKYARSGLA